MSTLELSVVMPCLNEEETLGICIDKAKGFMSQNNIDGEVIIADNGSTDRSVEIAESKNARVIHVKAKGYGNALRGGITASKGKYIIMGDADDSYDFSSLTLFIEKLREGYGLVMGNRFEGGIMDGAMPPVHRYFGNPAQSLVGRMFFKIDIGDFNCGLRGFSREAFDQMETQTTGMEFASEVVVKSALMGVTITEVPTMLHPDGRSRPPHLRTWRDGWRNLRFFLMYSPAWLFLYPGVLLMLFGSFISGAILFNGHLQIGHVTLSVHTLLYCSAMIIFGFQGVLFYVLTKIYVYTHDLFPIKGSVLKLLKVFSLEAGIVLGLLFKILGLVLWGVALYSWGEVGLGDLNVSKTMRVAIPSVSLLLFGSQILLNSFFISILRLKKVD
ncbi:glycosyltransferase [Fulvivirga sp. M361]|uniref:glycosyltransferase family 2 protein n=1 Tax=Fulvivirga sp. M361 TaxID=2594266 RepID=UPI00117A20A1|nr:glycosyltransferase [Fulvivirga sp. M361]TRX58378.1 glycosyltransferase [Fulvivirga sp. M361]